MGTEYEVLCQHLAQVSLSPGLNADVPNVPGPCFSHQVTLPTLRTSNILSWPFKEFYVISEAGIIYCKII